MRLALILGLVSAVALAGDERLEIPEKAKVRKFLLVHEHDWTPVVADSERVGEIEITPRGLRIRLNLTRGLHKVKTRRKGSHLIIEYAKRRNPSGFVPLMMIARRVYDALLERKKAEEIADEASSKLRLWLDGESHKAEAIK